MKFVTTSTAGHLFASLGSADRPGSRNEDQVGVVSASPDAHFWIEIPAEELRQYVDDFGVKEEREQEKVKASRAIKIKDRPRELLPEEVTSTLRAETEELLELATLLEQVMSIPPRQQFRQTLAYVRSTLDIAAMARAGAKAGRETAFAEAPEHRAFGHRHQRVQ